MIIAINEFAVALRRCLPAIARPVIAVANSGGPDSTCLLFLLSRLFHPRALLSVHVVHNLQSIASDMATTAAANAHSLGIAHHTIHIPWGVHPFPPLPKTGPVERIARDARYNLLFHVITRARVPLLALAHHADDQLETAIMRLAHGSSPLGAAGMLPLRRWGMGTTLSDSDLTSFGYHGMNTFVLRPFLPFPKCRILATCDAHHLPYITDPTNFQPHLTPRNAIRHCLEVDPHFSQPVSLSTTALDFEKVNHASLFLRSLAPDVHGEKQRLYTAVANLATRAARVHLKGMISAFVQFCLLICRHFSVTSHLADHRLPSPTGTLLLSSTHLRDITDPDVRFALVLRTIRYVSFHPWGSLRADADRRKSSIQRIVSALWASDPHASQISKFTAGGGVLWSPAIYNPTKPLRVGNQCCHSTLRSDDHFCWLASRVPPFSKNPQRGAGSSTRLIIDLTDRLREAMSSRFPTAPLQILYDGRFLLRIHPSQAPTYVKYALRRHGTTTSIKILPFTQYYWPKVVLQRPSHPDRILAAPQEDAPAITTESPSWISMQWIRPLDAV